MSSSGGISEEQRRRMEENRQKALQKRAEASAKLSNSQPNAINRGASTSISNNAQPNRPVHQIFQSQATSKNPPAQESKSSENKVPPSQSCPPAFSGPKITGTCHLISRDRFTVDLPWNKHYTEANNVFKSVKGNQFDVTTKKWNFPVSEHDKFLTAMEVLRHKNVYVGGVPAFVLRALRLSATAKQPSDINLSQTSIDPVLLHMLMPFQTEGVCFGLSREGRLLIADDMGLGKTIQALGIAHHYFSEWPLLIVCPSSMRYPWREAIWNWLPSVNPGSIAVVESTNDSVMSAKVVIISYDLLSRKSKDMDNFRVIIMDESHHLKNYKTARAKAALPLLQSAKRAILLSGTPALSRPLELYTQLSAINRNLFPGYVEFGVRYCAGKQTHFGWDFTGASNMEELQIVLGATCMIRRLKRDVLTQLPEKIRTMIIVDASLVKLKSKSLQTTAKTYLEHARVKSRETSRKLLEWYSETGKSKVEAVGAHLKELVEDNKKFLCFAHHKYVLDGVCDVLESVKCRYIRIDGSTPSEERNKLVELFQFNDSVLVAVLSITACNSGITLTAAHLVVFAELFWNPGILTQAEDRAHRIGQMDSVVIQYLVASGTADDEMWPMVQKKLEVLNKAGLSKDNFREADATALIQGNTNNQQKGIDDFFKPVSASQNARDCITNEDEACLNDNEDEELLQLLEESFNDSIDNGKTDGGNSGKSCFQSPGWGNNSNANSTNGCDVPGQPKKQKM